MTGPSGRIAGNNEQNMVMQFDDAGREAGISCRGHIGQPPDSVPELPNAIVTWGMGIGIDMAPTACPKKPTPRAISRTKDRRRLFAQWLMSVCITPRARSFKSTL
jgi:hypothetical protein